MDGLGKTFLYKKLGYVFNFITLSNYVRMVLSSWILSYLLAVWKVSLFLSLWQKAFISSIMGFLCNETARLDSGYITKVLDSICSEQSAIFAMTFLHSQQHSLKVVKSWKCNITFLESKIIMMQQKILKYVIMPLIGLDWSVNRPNSPKAISHLQHLF